MIPMRPSILSLAAVKAGLACVLLGTAAPALADDVEEAKRAFDKAETAYKLGKYKEAIESYEAAYRAMAEPAFLYNIAQAHRQQYNLDKETFHLHKALNLYKTYLRESKEIQRKQVVQNLIGELKQIISAVEANTPRDDQTRGRLILRGEIAKGGIIELDGKRWGTVPWSGEVKPGTHVVKVNKDGFETWSTTVKVPGGGEVDVAVLLTNKGSSAGSGKGGEVSETPIYKKWWLWTIVGVAVAGAGVGVGLGVHYSNGGDTVSSMPTIDLR